ncbi:hypothetical protein ACH4CC_29510 [Streptomyces lydicus]
MHRGDLIGTLARTGMRTAMRTMNHLPPVKRKIALAESSFRGAGRVHED